MRRGDRQAELGTRPTQHGVHAVLVRAGVSAERVRPDARPRELRERAPGHEDATVGPDDVAGEREVERRLQRVDGRLRRGADAGAVLGEQDDEFFGYRHASILPDDRGEREWTASVLISPLREVAS
ncbi:hypothetical protein PLANTIT3_50433 [Plantibacter sp. T3]|nr:hypothetical protein PLANTIT3_50433 [Plantibacter sp. T3]